MGEKWVVLKTITEVKHKLEQWKKKKKVYGKSFLTYPSDEFDISNPVPEINLYGSNCSTTFMVLKQLQDFKRCF